MGVVPGRRFRCVSKARERLSLAYKVMVYALVYSQRLDDACFPSSGGNPMSFPRGARSCQLAVHLNVRFCMTADDLESGFGQRNVVTYLYDDFSVTDIYAEMG